MGRLCKRHGVKLKRTIDMGTGETYWYCPKEKCDYRENEKGEKI